MNYDLAADAAGRYDDFTDYPDDIPYSPYPWTEINQPLLDAQLTVDESEVNDQIVDF